VKTVRMALFAATLLAAAVAQFFPSIGETSERARIALLIEIDGAIGPATARQVKEGLTTAAERNAEVVVLRLNTPGGLATSGNGNGNAPNAPAAANAEVVAGEQNGR